MISFHINVNSGLPIYRQLMDQLRFYIASGAIQTGEQLPSIRVLAKQLAVNPTTIVKAYNELAHAGVIELRQGKGAFAAAPVESDADNAELLLPMVRQLVTESQMSGVTLKKLKQLIEQQYREVSRDNSKKKGLGDGRD